MFYKLSFWNFLCISYNIRIKSVFMRLSKKEFQTSFCKFNCPSVSFVYAAHGVMFFFLLNNSIFFVYWHALSTTSKVSSILVVISWSSCTKFFLMYLLMHHNHDQDWKLTRLEVFATSLTRYCKRRTCQHKSCKNPIILCYRIYEHEYCI